MIGSRTGGGDGLEVLLEASLRRAVVIRGDHEEAIDADRGRPFGVADGRSGVVGASAGDHGVIGQRFTDGGEEFDLFVMGQGR